MTEKLRNSRGETLVEVLACVLICTLSIALLLGSVTSSSNIDLQAQTADEAYYEALSKAERQAPAPAAPVTPVDPGDPGGADTGDTYGEASATLTITDAADNSTNPPSKTIADVEFYGSERLLSYALEKSEEGS